MTSHQSWMKIRTSRAPWFGMPALVYLCLLLAAPAEAQIQVNSADPNAAPQATVNLNVIVKGKGFKRGAVAKWQVTGTEDAGGVTVNATTFVNSSELVANIDVAETAVISLYDIQVRNADGRIGKGTELFSVLAKGSGTTGSVSLNGTFRDAGDPLPDRVASDGSPYLDGVNGVSLSVSGNDNFGLQINTQSNNQGNRNLILNFSDCVPSFGPCTPPFLEGSVGSTLGTFAKLVVFRTDNVAPGDLAVGQSGMFNAHILVGGGVVVDPTDGEQEVWFVSFRTPTADSVCSGSGSGPLRVSHPTPDIWEVEATTGDLACLFSQVNKRSNNKQGTEFMEFHGTYRMPFLLRLERQP